MFFYDWLQAELTFSAGDIIHVFGDMDEDGFFYVSVNMTLAFGVACFLPVIFALYFYTVTLTNYAVLLVFILKNIVKSAGKIHTYSIYM